MQTAPDLPLQFLIYAALFRLTVVGGGIASVTFGYRLLSAAVGRKKSADGSLIASVGGAQLALRNLAPGTMFAAFGMVLIGVMLYQGMPELKQQGGQGSIQVRSSSGETPAEDFPALTARAAAFAQAGNAQAATEAYEDVMDRLALPANGLATLYLQQNRNREALALARFAADLRPFRAGILDTLASAYDRTGNHAAALQAAERAAELDAQFVGRLESIQRKEPR